MKVHVVRIYEFLFNVEQENIHEFSKKNYYYQNSKKKF
jgi:hypothetical protein